MIEQLVTAWGRPSPLVTASVLLAIVVGIGGQYVSGGAVTAVIAASGACRCPAQAAAVALSSW